MPRLRLQTNLLAAIEAAGRAGGTDPHLFPRPDAGSAAKKKFGFLPELGFGARVRTMPLSESARLLLGVFLQVSFCWGKRCCCQLTAFR